MHDTIWSPDEPGGSTIIVEAISQALVDPADISSLEGHPVATSAGITPNRHTAGMECEQSEVAVVMDQQDRTLAIGREFQDYPLDNPEVDTEGIITSMAKTLERSGIDVKVAADGGYYTLFTEIELTDYVDQGSLVPSGTYIVLGYLRVLGHLHDIREDYRITSPEDMRLLSTTERAVTVPSDVQLISDPDELDNIDAARALQVQVTTVPDGPEPFAFQLKDFTENTHKEGVCGCFERVARKAIERARDEDIPIVSKVINAEALEEDER